MDSELARRLQLVGVGCALAAMVSVIIQAVMRGLTAFDMVALVLVAVGTLLMVLFGR